MKVLVKLSKITAVICCCYLLFSCEKQQEPLLNIRTFGFPDAVYNFSNNPISAEKIQLGRFLFYDPILSLDSSISCGNCHAPEHAFAGHNEALSTGVNGAIGKRNSPSLSNLIWYPSFSWDGGINHLEIQPVTPITDTLEMHENLANVLTKLNGHWKYPTLFKEAFGVTKIEDQQLLFALTQFMGTLISDQSKFDQCLTGRDEFTEQEKKGYEIFSKNCAVCHSGALFTDFTFHDNGLTEKKQSELGRYRITQQTEDKWKFRVPSLRNVALTYPYMHNGEIQSLEEVIEKYSNGNGSSTDKLLPENGFSFSEEEKKALLSFLKTLNDYDFIANPNYGPNTYLLNEN